MPGDLITPLDSNPPDSSLNLVPPTIRNLQIIDNNSLHLQDIIKADGGLMGAYNAIKPQKIILTDAEMWAIFPHADRSVLREVTTALNNYMYDFGLTNNLLVAQFLGQVKVEANGLVHGKEDLMEDLYYKTVSGLYKNFSIFDSHWDKKNKKWISSPYNAKDYLFNSDKLGELVYKGYWGRGLLQLTWLTNYTGFSDYMKAHYNWSTRFDTVQNRNLIKTNITDAVVSALWFFKTNIIDPSTKWQHFKNSTLKISHQEYISDDSVTKKINPALLKRFERIDATYNAKQVLYRNSLHPFSFSRFNTPYSSYPFELFPPHQQSIPLHPFQIFPPLDIPLKRKYWSQLDLNYKNQPYQSQSMFEQISGHTLMSLYAPHHGAIHQNLIHTTPQNLPHPSTRPSTPLRINPLRGFNTTPPGIGNGIVPTITPPVIQNLTVNNTTNSTMSKADIQKHVAQLLTAAASDGNIKSGSIV